MFPVRTVAYVPEAPPGTFCVTMGGKAAGFLYLCQLGTEGVVDAVATHASPVGVLCASLSGKFRLSGADDGSVKVAPVDGEKHWHSVVHDGIHGAVTGVAMSFDDTHLLSTASDGSFFVQKVSPKLGVKPSDKPSPSVPKAALDPAEVSADITTADTYSIEEAKQKTEEDNLRRAAEEKKMGVRQYLARIREEFLQLLEQNSRRSEGEQLPREAFEIDPGLRAMIESETSAKIDRARRELAWQSEKCRVALGKMKAWFVDGVECERIVLRSFSTGRSQVRCTSFRVGKLSDEMQEAIASVHQRVAADEAEARASSTTVDGMGGMPAMARRSQQSEGIGGDSGAGFSMTGGTDSEKPLTKMDLRRLQRKKRAEEWEKFRATKPADNYENPQDMEAIRIARDNMGDFKLKTDPDYIVPEKQRVNAEKKRRQMVLLQQALHTIKMDFNEKFLALRELKGHICREIEAGNAQVEEINAELSEEESLMEVKSSADEYPKETRETITYKDLVAFEKESKEAEKRAAGGGAMGGFSSGGAQKADEDMLPPPSAEDDGEPAAKAAAAVAADPRTAAMKAATLSELELAEQRARHLKLRYEKDRIKSRQQEMVTTFDESLRELRREKLQLEADLKSADMKQLVLYQELVLLKEFEKRDNSLKVKLDNKNAEKTDILTKTQDCQDKLETKKEEVEKLLEKKAQIVSEFDHMVEDTNTFRDALMKVFNKKIKRVKKKAKDDEDEDYDSEEEEEDEDEDEDFDEDDEDEVCPPGCDQALYEKVMDLREKRLDQEDVIAEFLKSIDALKKEKDALMKKQKLIESSLKSIDGEIQEFQKEKQSKLNEIDVIVTLKMHQMEYLVNGKLPEDLSVGLVFSNDELRRLKNRIKELIEEKSDLKKKQKDLRGDHNRLQRDKKLKEARIADLEGRAKQVQMLKFGQEIDLEVLDRMGSNKGAEDLKEQLKQQEYEHGREVREWSRQIDQSKMDLSKLVAENTECLNAVAELTTTQKKLEQVLSTTQGSLFNDPVQARRREVAERDHLVQVVNAQAAEIESLKSEIQVLRHKGGLIYA